VVVTIVTGVIVNEICDFSPVAGSEDDPWAASTWALGDERVARVYEEEWAAVINDCPGKLYKLFRALQFAAGAFRKAQAYRIRVRFHLLADLGARNLRRRQVVSFCLFLLTSGRPAERLGAVLTLREVLGQGPSLRRTVLRRFCTYLESPYQEARDFGRMDHETRLVMAAILQAHGWTLPQPCPVH
jgi:hypothetical protein